MTLLRAVTAVAGISAAVLGVCGCSSPNRTASAPPDTPTLLTPVMPAPPADPGPLPPPEALSDVMSRLADPAVPGSAKLPLVSDAGPPDSAAFDRFATALRDTGVTPVTVTATDLRWSSANAGNVVATVSIAGAGSGNPDKPGKPDKPGEFSFPMEFHRGAAGWQLTRETADMLLAFGTAPATSPPP